jgi:WD40 repeat protein
LYEEIGVEDDEREEIEYSLVDECRAERQRIKEERMAAERERLAEALKAGEEPDYDPIELFYKQEDNDADQYLAVRPWKRQIRAPPGHTKPAKNQEKAPAVNARIEWVHGYRGYKCRNNARFLVDGSIAYHAAGLGVVTEPKLKGAEVRNQRHFDKHSDDVTCMAFSNDRRLVATGEIGKKPVIYIWDALSLQVKQKI